MAVIDRIKFDGLKSRDWLVYKHPTETIVRGAQLVVGEGQAAIFVKSGRILDLFNAGTYTLDAENLPLLQGFLNIPFGGKTPLTAEIYYINITSKLDVAWGTSDPIQLIDPKYNIKLRVRAFGQMGMKVNDYALFLRELIGVMSPREMVRIDNIASYFKGLIIQKMKSIIAEVIIKQKISALEISAEIDRIAELSREKITPTIEQFGLKVINFFIKSINFPDEDFEEINQILSDKAEFEIMGDSRYAVKRSFDVYEGAANNESGVAGAFAAGGMGLGIGASIGANAQQTFADTSSDAVICSKCHFRNKAGAKFCSQCGSSFIEKSTQVKICPECKMENSPDANFCYNCGKEIKELKCSNCGAKLNTGARFCSSCGKEVE
ncbi:MAG: SPFH domain-containing protein [Clostridiales bacterium]|nr:SPFH domain-containing protein [Clostridiales bacterium]